MAEAGGSSFWLGDAEAALKEVQSSTEGLSSAEAAARLQRQGPNLSIAERRSNVLAKLARRLAEPLIAILLIAALVSGITGDWQSCIVIVLIVFCSIGLDIFQEQKAEATIEALKRSVAVKADVLRDGALRSIPVADIVPGDIVDLRGGDLVPADGIVLSSNGAMADEAALTGEPYGVEKRPGPSTGATPADAFNALFAGTSLTNGEARMLVMATGAATRFGGIAASLEEQGPPAAFERGVHALGMLILRLTGFLVLFVVLAQLLRHGLTLEGFLFAVALAVGLTPELLPMITTVTLARGGERMARLKVVVKRLSAIHDLGAIDVLCTDKTGTLTEARIVLSGSFRADGADSARVTDLLRRNSRFARGVRSGLDAAAMEGATGDDKWSLVDDAPFDFQRRRAAVLVTDGKVRQLIAKGAPEAMLDLCNAVEQADGTPAQLDGAAKARIEKLVSAKGGEGLRLLAVARRDMPSGQAAISPADETDMVLVGFAAFMDPPKASAAGAVARLHAAGVRVKIISGDARAVVEHVVGALKLPSHGVLEGSEIDHMSDAALARRVGSVDLFARISPEQKRRIVMALRHRGHTVGFMGDGINDAPAIHAADVGISVDGGTDVARQAADIILLAPELGVLADGVAEGRRTYANIMKYVRMGTSSNFGNMLSMAAASVFLPFLPLAPLQVLLNNLLYDLSEIGIPFDAADAEDLAHPKTWNMKSVLRFTLVMGPLSSVFDMLTFAWLQLGLHAPVASFRTAWFVESIATQILVIFVIRTARPVWSSRPDRVLVASSLDGLALALLLALTPLGGFVGFGPLEPVALAGIAAITAVYLGMAELLKRFALGPQEGVRARALRRLRSVRP
ncbi:MAG TPA: magnesium-translocating P-type ATPase [Devosia sp.]|nr:magnesium-translocating P-type ATPase [Devosia sp.]